MALDDGVELHERLGSTFRILQSSTDKRLSYYPSYPWQVLFLPVYGTLGLFMLAFLWRQAGHRFTRFLLITGVGCFVVATGLDFFEGLDEYHPWNLYGWLADLSGVGEFTMARFNRDAFEAVRHFGKTIEEAIEMLGMTLLWIVFLDHLMRITGEISLRFQEH